MNSCISSVRTIFKKRWNDSVLQVSPISLDNTVGPPKQRQCTPPVQFKWVKYHSQSNTSIVPALKNELLNSLLTFSSGKVLLCRQTQIRFGVPVQCLCSKDDNVSAALQLAVFAHTFMASLGYWMGNINVARWNGIHFLIPKHLQKCKIGLLEQIWAKNPYVTFFLGHPVHCTMSLQ